MLEQDWESSRHGMPTLGFGASEAELAPQDWWHMEYRWEQAALCGVEPQSDAGATNVCQSCQAILRMSLSKLLIASCFRKRWLSAAVHTFVFPSNLQ